MALIKWIIITLILLVIIFYIFGEERGMEIVKKTGEKMIELAKKLANKIPESEIKNISEGEKWEYSDG